MKRYFIIFDGRVQGVGFRSYVQMQAITHHCTGWIRNMENGKVEMELQGSIADIDHILRILKEGNMFIRVDDYVLKEIPLQQEDRFTIRY